MRLVYRFRFVPHDGDWRPAHAPRIGWEARDVEAAKRAMTGNLEELRRHVVAEARQIVAHAASVGTTAGTTDRTGTADTVEERKAV